MRILEPIKRVNYDDYGNNYIQSCDINISLIFNMESQ